MRKKQKRKSAFHPAYWYVFSIVAAGMLVNLLYPVVKSKFVVSCANSLSCKESLALKIENDTEGIFNNKKVTVPNIPNSPLASNVSVLGTASGSAEKRIYIDLTTQTLMAYQGNKLFMKTLISSGRWGRTPKGDFAIWVKIRSTRMSGGSGTDYYNLPNVPYVMYFSNSNVPASVGFGLHGTYWHNNFGHAMSHGCVNLKTTDAAKLYEWAEPRTDGHTTHADNKNKGTKITIFGDPPV